MQCSRTPVATPFDSFALKTPEAIVLDGANGVSGEPRAHFPSAGISLPVALLAALLTATLLRTRVSRQVLVVGLVLAALPGLAMVLWLRADAPPRRGEMASTVRVTLDELRTQAPWPQRRVMVAREDDDVLFPLARYAIPTRPIVKSPDVVLELRGSKLGQVCRLDPPTSHLVCGAGP